MITKVSPYLNFLGNTEEAFNFYKLVFGREFASLIRFKDTSEAGKIAKEDENKIMHIALPINATTILMGTDALESAGHKLTSGDNVSLHLQVESKEEADAIFTKLSAGSNKIEMPMADTFWGDYFGSFTDKFGTQWMISYTYSKK